MFTGIASSPTTTHTRSPPYNSIKSVAPALCPGFGYDDLEGIADGAAASAAFLQLASGYLTAREEADRLRADLLAYCQRDTLALLRVHQSLATLNSMLSKPNATGPDEPAQRWHLAE